MNIDRKEWVIRFLCLALGFVLCFSLFAGGLAKRSLELSDKFGGSYHLYWATESTTGEPFLNCFSLELLDNNVWDCYSNSITGFSEPFYHSYFRLKEKK